jgi:penicillin amidase
MISGDNYQIMGEGMGALGARQQQIRDRLLEIQRFSEVQFLAIHLDDEAIFLDRWQKLLLDTLSDQILREHPSLKDFHRYVEDWKAHADANSVGYLLVKRFRERVIDQTVGHIFRHVADQSNEFWMSRVDNKVEYPVWKLVTEQPSQHQPKGYNSWNHFLVEMAMKVDGDLSDTETGLTEQTWGNHNTLAIQHPLSKAIPILAQFLDMPEQPMSGDTFMPRVQARSSGASQRMAVSPGHEDSGYFHMPAGQSGHPLSPFYRSGHEDWVKGIPSPFLPGDSEYILELVPETGP